MKDRLGLPSEYNVVDSLMYISFVFTMGTRWDSSSTLAFGFGVLNVPMFDILLNSYSWIFEESSSRDQACNQIDISNRHRCLSSLHPALFGILSEYWTILFTNSFMNLSLGDAVSFSVKWASKKSYSDALIFDFTRLFFTLISNSRHGSWAEIVG